MAKAREKNHEDRTNFWGAGHDHLLCCIRSGLKTH